MNTRKKNLLNEPKRQADRLAEWHIRNATPIKKLVYNTPKPEDCEQIDYEVLNKLLADIEHPNDTKLVDVDLLLDAQDGLVEIIDHKDEKMLNGFTKKEVYKTLPKCLYDYLTYERLPAINKHPFDFERSYGSQSEPADNKALPALHEPKPCFATEIVSGKRVRIVMASRFGDVGITENLQDDRGYQKRVMILELNNFSSEW